jgi:hypothetical protein
MAEIAAVEALLNAQLLGAIRVLPRTNKSNPGGLYTALEIADEISRPHSQQAPSPDAVLGRRFAFPHYGLPQLRVAYPTQPF